MPVNQTAPAGLAVIAGGGVLPRKLVEAARGNGRRVVVVAFEGQTDPGTVEGVPHLWSRLGSVGAILQWLHEQQVAELVMAGRIRRPSWAELGVDWRGAAFLARVGASALGDDGLLRAISHGLEGEGFRVVAVQDIVRELLAPVGCFGCFAPDPTADVDIARGLGVARGLGALDVGQAVVVQQGLVLGVEAIEGTDALLDRCGALRRDGPGGVLVKIRKPQQDHRLDLPAIGVTTVERAAAAGLAGIAVEAGGALVIDRPAVIEAADRLGLFAVGVAVDRAAGGRAAGERAADWRATGAAG